MPSFCVAGVALMAWGSALGPDFVVRNAAAVCVTGMALSTIHLHFTWPAWRKLISAVILRGRCGTYDAGWRASARFGRAWRRGWLRGNIHLRFTWQLWRKLTSTVILRGKCGTYGIGGALGPGIVARNAAAVCAAGVALGDIHFCFMW